MKTLLAFGCSNTRGAEAIHDYDTKLEDDNININHAYPKYVAELLGYSYHNLAMNGVSNQQIASKVFETLSTISNVEDVFVLIGWTDDDRIAVVNEPCSDFRYAKKSDVTTTISHSHVIACTKAHIGQPMTVTEMDHTKRIRKLPLDFIIGVAERIFLSKNFSDTNFYIKYATACFLEEKKIPYLTLPTLQHHYSSLYNIFYNTGKQKNNIQLFNENGKLVFNYLKRFGEYGVSKSGAHLKAEGHRQAGIFLYDYIVNNNLL